MVAAGAYEHELAAVILAFGLLGFAMRRWDIPVGHFEDFLSSMRMDLTEAIAMIKASTLDAQENPLANTVTYGVHKFHRFHTLTNHF